MKVAAALLRQPVPHEVEVFKSPLSASSPSSSLPTSVPTAWEPLLRPVLGAHAAHDEVASQAAAAAFGGSAWAAIVAGLLRRGLHRRRRSRARRCHLNSTWHRTATPRRRFPRLTRRAAEAAVSAAPASETATPPARGIKTWSELEKMFRALDAGRRLRRSQDDQRKGLEPHVDARTRHFGKQSQQKPRVKLYRDSAAWCADCQMVWLYLEEKEIDYTVETHPLRSYGKPTPEFLSKVPQGILPAVEIDGRLISSGIDIMFALEREFQEEEQLMFPIELDDIAHGVQLLELDRNLVAAWRNFLFAPDPLFLNRREEDLCSALQQVDDELRRCRTSPWFFQWEHPTLVDMRYVTHIERIVASCLYYKGLDVRHEFRNIDRWLSSWERIPYYLPTKGDFYTHCMAIRSDYGEPHADESPAVRGLRSFFNPLNARLPVLWDGDPELVEARRQSAPQRRLREMDYRAEAAWSLLSNRKAVVEYCCRTAGGHVGEWGQKRCKAELSDPLAPCGMSPMPAVEAVLQAVVEALLSLETERPLFDLKTKLKTALGSDAPEVWDEVCTAVEYLRDRISVPRDMRMQSAKLLRCYLGEVVFVLRS
eukprot:TRINITY_DN82206_c0_g1_i1.p1 TRINITY_DN82206_c0_g1~~TRINITY_DN82206_c0_g1_i1.p1  ORF type:complete len:595 (-),score=103.58 TRINITY_DN82206_c0_g1_i1:53-1837(-)